MTAVVGILNKQAVALAADSAVTILGQNNRKIFNHANKIFRVSNRQPIGLMLYNSAEFMGTPWETIIKIFRDEVDMLELGTVLEWQQYFIDFLRKNNYFADEQVQNNYLYYFCISIFETINRQALQENFGILLEQNNQQKVAKGKIETEISNAFDKISKDNLKVTEDFVNLNFIDFAILAKSEFDVALQTVYTNHGFDLANATVQKLFEIVFFVFRSQNFLNSFTGLVFAGFGKNEIFPALVSTQIASAWRGRLRFFVDQSQCASISINLQSAIRPFAQKDVINTILTGIDPSLSSFFLQSFGSFLAKYNSYIGDLISKENPVLAQQIQGINLSSLTDEFASAMAKYQQNSYVNPLMGAVVSLSKDDLAEMAESLIYLTYLKRRITFAEESVGGPVDVAIISKSDGFIWKKRKHYFKPELNPHFFTTYLR